ncbi:alpha/beta-Hydrolase [Penicillium herquei]|nr:alpha/beta-Hydrolase [Penicillium herquei]
MGLEHQFVTALYSASHQALPCHTVDIWHPLGDPPGADDGLWIIFIHGGAWRDPSITSQFAHTAVSKLCRSGGQAGIAGIASINYRLSPSDRHPGKANDPCRQAKHPDHLVDVVAAIHYLQERFQFGDRYIMIGHSCGAALAFQTLQWQARNPSPGFSEPRAIVGVAGIYDFPLLRSLDPKPPTV